MGRHRIPDAARLQFGHPHLQLAGGQYLLHDHPVNHTVVALLERAEFEDNGLFTRHFRSRVGGMRRGRVEVEFRGSRFVVAAEDHLLVAAADVEGLLETDRVGLSFDGDGSSAPDVDDSHLAARGKVVGRQDVHRLEPERRVHRHRAAHDQAVVHRIGEVDLIGNHQPLDEELLAQACRIVIFRITRVRRVTQAEIGFHFWSFLWWCRIVPAPAITGLIRERGHGKFSGTGPPCAGWAAGPDASSEPAGLLPKRSPATLAVIGGYFLIKSARIGVKLSTRRNCLVVDFTVCGTLLGTAKISPVLRCCTGRSPM